MSALSPAPATAGASSRCCGCGSSSSKPLAAGRSLAPPQHARSHASALPSTGSSSSSSSGRPAAASRPSSCASAASTSGRTAAAVAAAAAGAGLRPKLPHRPPRATHARTRTRALPGELPGLDAQGLSNLVSAALLAAIGWQLLRQQDAEAEEQSRHEGRQSCERCEGKGWEECFCTRWSDGDKGCNSCNRTGYLRCRNCGGGGTMVPVFKPVQLEVRERE